MNLWHSVMTGVMQGVTEFIPVSSSGHLILLYHLLGVNNQIPVLFDILLHVSTLIVIFVIYRSQIKRLILGTVLWIMPSKQNQKLFVIEKKMLSLLFFCTVSTGMVGFGIKFLGVIRNAQATSAMLLITALLLILARVMKSRGKNQIMSLSWKWALLVGLIQGLAVLPGISRSGSTIAIGVILGADYKTASDFSFLSVIPATLGALLFSLGEISDLSIVGDWFILIVGMASAFIAGWISLKYLLRIIKKGQLHYFSIYLILVGVLGIVFL